MRTAPRVRTGLDVLIEDDGFASLRGLRVGVIANPTSVDRRFRHLADILHAAEGVELAALFAPEHGIRADAQDMIGVGAEIDPRTGAVVHSLYGPDAASLMPTPAQLAGLDALIYDVQDVGSRYYTFAATMKYAMTAAAARGLRFVVLDRPNPIGGRLVEGPTVRPGFESFVGAHPLPIRHGMTVGELAGLVRSDLGLDLDLTIHRLDGWRRDMLWDETGLPWINPSPNMPSALTALVYPGGCLVEGTNLSEGRGTTRPFELWGAPWLDPDRLAEAAAPAVGAGVALRPCAFIPTFHKHAGQVCRGVQPHVTDPDAFRPVRAFTALLAAARAQDPGRFGWRTEPYEFVSDPIAIDLLYGSDRERRAIEAGTPADAIAAVWAEDEAAFLARRAPFLLYA